MRSQATDTGVPVPPRADQAESAIEQSSSVVGAVPPEELAGVADRLDDPIVTHLLLAGEELAAPLREAEKLRNRAPHAQPIAPVSMVSDGAQWIVDIARHAAMRLAEDPHRAGIASRICEALGDGQALALLFDGFLPSRRPPILLDAAGHAILTKRQVEILREASRDLSHAEIADNLGVSPRTVSTHLERIYRRLGVNKPMQAVARAVAMGYLDLDAVGFVRSAGGAGLRDFSTLHAMLGRATGVEHLSGGPSLRRLAQFGVLLALTAAASSIILASDVRADTAMVGVVCRLDRSGKVREAFGGDRLRQARGLAIGTPQSERHGFIPGAVYVANSALAQHRLNSAEIVEFVPSASGGYSAARAFAGGIDVATRLADPSCLVFDREGRLLVTTGELTDAILVFTEGGARVARLATARAMQLAIGTDGEVYAACAESAGSTIRAFGEADSEGSSAVASAPPGMFYSGVAVGPDGSIYVLRVDRGRGAVEVLTAGGDPVRLFTTAGLRAATLCTDHSGLVYAPCPATGDIKVFSATGHLLRRIPLEGIITPYALAAGSDGSMWVCGQAE